MKTRNEMDILALLVPLVVIVMIFLTKNVFLSLMVGLVSGGLLVNLANPLNLPIYLYEKFFGLFYGADGIILGKFYIIGFLLLLGVMGEFFLQSGGVEAFGLWLRQKIRSPKQSESVLFFLGIIIFIDGCFNAVILGQIARSIGEVYQITKERLAYIVDSTSSPVCVLVPFSSWGASILAILQDNLSRDKNAFFVLLGSIGFNFYAWLTLICVAVVILWQVDAPMQKYMIDQGTSSQEQVNPSKTSPLLIFIPFVLLFVSIFALVFFDGYHKVGSLDWMQIFSRTDVNQSLFFGGLAGLVSLFILVRLKRGQYLYVFKSGVGSMMPAIGVLILAWGLAPILKEDLQIGTILSHLFENQIQLNTPLILPLFLFVISMLISFSTGTSWGCFAIMLPIGISVASSAGTDMSLAVASVLGGALYGDHTSPISDTTILSSASTRCLLHNHFVTQMFYAGVCAFGAFVAYLIYAWSKSVVLGFSVSIALLVGILYLTRGSTKD